MLSVLLGIRLQEFSKEAMSQAVSGSVRYVSRQENYVAHFLANFLCVHFKNSPWEDSLPSFIRSYVMADLLSV